jgi:hypothetical protein
MHDMWAGKAHAAVEWTEAHAAATTCATATAARRGCCWLQPHLCWGHGCCIVTVLHQHLLQLLVWSTGMQSLQDGS